MSYQINPKIELTTLFKKPYCTIFIKKHYSPYGKQEQADIIEQHTLYAILPQEDCIMVTFDSEKFYFKDYGKTWALTKEEL